jgi:hypothetical protein
MQYRSFPKLVDEPVSALGFGCMRLPVRPDGSVDEVCAIGLIQDAAASGINYFDTAWPYHGGQSEVVLGKALLGALRDRVKVATKCPVWLVGGESDWERLLDEQLKRLQTDHIDYYLLHALSSDRWATVQRLKGLQAMEKARLDGRIRHIGFSFHDSADQFRKVLEGYDWEFCQIQFNYLDEQYQAGLAGLKLAASRNVGVVVMEPLRGGALAKVPPSVQSIFDESGKGWAAVEWALRWVWDFPEVVTVLSGMSAPEQLRENLQIAQSSISLNAEDLKLVERVKEEYRQKIRVPCTTCGYCQPCPTGVAIPNVFTAYNSAVMFDSKATAAMGYRNWVMGIGSGADQCVACGDCESKCPQNIPIVESLKEAHGYLVE